jgi:hypothetical protein
VLNAVRTSTAAVHEAIGSVASVGVVTVHDGIDGNNGNDGIDGIDGEALLIVGVAGGRTSARVTTKGGAGSAATGASAPAGAGATVGDGAASDGDGVANEGDGPDGATANGSGRIVVFGSGAAPGVGPAFTFGVTSVDGGGGGDTASGDETDGRLGAGMRAGVSTVGATSNGDESRILLGAGMIARSAGGDFGRRVRSLPASMTDATPATAITTANEVTVTAIAPIS